MTNGKLACPQCNNQFSATLSRCPICDVPLVATGGHAGSAPAPMGGVSAAPFSISGFDFDIDTLPPKPAAAPPPPSTPKPGTPVPSQGLPSGSGASPGLGSGFGPPPSIGPEWHMPGLSTPPPAAPPPPSGTTGYEGLSDLVVMPRESSFNITNPNHIHAPPPDLDDLFPGLEELSAGVGAPIPGADAITGGPGHSPVQAYGNFPPPDSGSRFEMPSFDDLDFGGTEANPQAELGPSATANTAPAPAEYSGGLGKSLLDESIARLDAIASGDTVTGSDDGNTTIDLDQQASIIGQGSSIQGSSIYESSIRDRSLRRMIDAKDSEESLNQVSPEQIRDELEEPLAKLLKKYAILLLAGGGVAAALVGTLVYFVVSGAVNKPSVALGTSTATSPDAEQSVAPTDEMSLPAATDAATAVAAATVGPVATAAATFAPTGEMIAPRGTAVEPEPTGAALFEMLRNPDEKKAQLAISALKNEGASVIPILIPLLQGEDDLASRRAAKVLSELGPEGVTAIPALLDALRAGRFKVGIAARDALVSMGEPAAPGLGKILQESDEQLVRMLASEALEKLGEKAAPAVEAIVLNGLADANTATVSNSLKSVRAIGAPAVPYLQTLLGSKRAQTRLVACAAVQSLGPVAAAAVPELMSALRENTRDIPPAASRALVAIGAPAVPKLVEALSVPLDHVRKLAGDSLARIGAPAVDGLLGALKSEDAQTRNYAAVALGQMGSAGKRAVPALQAAADAGNETSYYAKEALRKIAP